MKKALLLDAGGVLVYPRYGTWYKTKDFDRIMGRYLKDIPAPEHFRALGFAASRYNDAMRIETEEEEIKRDRAFYELAYKETLGLPVSEEELDALALGRAADPDRFKLYDDVPAALDHFKEDLRLKLALVSDTSPLLLTFFKKYDLLKYFDAVSVSFRHGVLKPAPVMYEYALEELSVRPEEAVFTDDMDKNLLGAEALGIQAVKMERPFYTDDTASGTDSPGGTVHDMEELGDLL